MDPSAAKLNANPTIVQTTRLEKRLSPFGGGLNTDNGNDSAQESADSVSSIMKRLYGKVAEPEAAGAEAEAKEKEPSREGFDAAEIFDLIRDIRDPEHPLSLEELAVVQLRGIDVDDAKSRVRVVFTPTVPHCSMSTLIGLSIRVKLMRTLPSRFKVDIYVEPGSHVSEGQVNKQLNDKERTAAALENPQLRNVVNKSLTPSAGI